MALETQRFENLFEAVPHALLVVHPAGTILRSNIPAETLFHYDREDLVGQLIQVLIPEYDWEACSKQPTESLTETRNRSVTAELAGRHQDGSSFPVNVVLSHLDEG
ncbi:PAS domain S-box protein, partial [Cryobacterium sp. MLB-32]|uniref:PAS domain S-box protein n=1 Tax=Cryobacterium sp. MLB-32 TaxID=1529318 RepID=UPI0018CEA05B